MDRDEAAAFIKDALQNRRQLWRDDPHFVKRLSDRSFSLLDALNVLKYGRISRDPVEEDDPPRGDEEDVPRYIDVHIEGKSCDGDRICVLVKVNPAGHCILWSIWSV